MRKFPFPKFLLWLAFIAWLPASGAFGLTGYLQMLNDLVALEKAGKEAGDPRVSVYTIGNSVEGRQIPIVLLKDPTVPMDQLKKLLIICRQHGDEPAGTEAALSLIKRLATTQDEARKAVLKRVAFFIIPMANPDGACALRRRNANGVDLNRDWITQSQPETRAILGAVKLYRPDVVIDAHELSPGNPTGDFIEAASERAGASAEVARTNRALQVIAHATLRAYGQFPDRIDSQTPREPNLAHRYFSVALGIPAMLFETRQSGARAFDLASRMDIHALGMMAVARYLAGDSFEDIQQMLAARAKARSVAELPARGGKSGKQWRSTKRSSSRGKLGK